MMADLDPCDLGDRIEVVHEVEEAVEIEMDCAVDDEAPAEPDPGDTIKCLLFTAGELAGIEHGREPVVEDLVTHPFVRESAPYERLELHFETNAFVRDTIEEAKRL